MSLLGWFRDAAISEAEVRAEIWHLGTRHFGEPLEGARRELAAPELTVRRARLLHSCIRKLQCP